MQRTAAKKDFRTNYSIGGGVIQGQDMNGREGFQDPKYNYNSLLNNLRNGS